MPLAYGWGTGGMQVTAAAILGPDDVLKVIDQGSDDTTNAISIREILRASTAGVATTDRYGGCHRDPDKAPHSRRRRCTAGQVHGLSGAASPSRCASWSRARPRRGACTRLAEYGLMHVKLYEDIARFGRIIATAYAYPVKVERALRDGRRRRSPKFDNPKMDNESGAATVRSRTREAHLRRSRRIPRWSRLAISKIIRSTRYRFDAEKSCDAVWSGGLIPISTKSSRTTAADGLFVCSVTPIIASPAAVGRPPRQRKRRVAQGGGGMN